MTAEEYRKFLDTDFDDVEIKDMKDIRDIRIDRNLSREKRTGQYLRQVGNPYFVRGGRCEGEDTFRQQRHDL